MTRRSKTRAAAEAKPAPKAAKDAKPAASAATRRDAKAGLGKAGPAKASPAKASPGKASPGKASPGKASPGKSEPVKKASVKAGRPSTTAPRAKSSAPTGPAKPPKTAKPTSTTASSANAQGAARKAVASRRAGTAVTAAEKGGSQKPATGKRQAIGTASTAKASARSSPPTKKTAAARKKAAKAPPRQKAKEPSYLAADLGQPVDREGEPIGAGSAILNSDSALQEYALRLWRQMQSGGVVNRYMRAIERAGLTVDEVWTAGVIETRSTSSTADEMHRYKQKLLFRANLLEAILTETVADLHRLEGIVPADAPTLPPPGTASESA